MKIVLFIFLLITNMYSLSDMEKITIDKAFQKLKNDEFVMKNFYFIGKMECYKFAQIGNQKYIKTSLDMLKNTYFRMPATLLGYSSVDKYFNKVFTKELLYQERVELAKNQELYKNRHRQEYWTGYYVCEKLNELTKDNKYKYKIFVEKYKVYSTHIYKYAKKYLSDNFYYQEQDKVDMKPMKKPHKLLINLKNETKIVISQTSGKEYTAEASAMRASIWLANLNYNVPKKYIDDVGRVGKMKNKPIIATAKKFKKFMDNEFSYQTINIELNATSNITFLKNKFANKRGLYIFIPSNSEQFGLTGYITIWDGNISNNRKYIFQRKGKATLYIFDDKQTQKNHTKPK